MYYFVSLIHFVYVKQCDGHILELSLTLPLSRILVEHYKIMHECQSKIFSHLNQYSMADCVFFNLLSNRSNSTNVNLF